ncbi:MAG: dihydropteroate synthase [Candidatus Omnitrophica bacterium]|nr:dihydropteroate synthase [Candidatus Omnitrophota bacterium]MDD5430129.1 dihydropteroate synthase [Candidatus Omnitrophota bacterium]
MKSKNLLAMEMRITPAEIKSEDSARSLMVSLGVSRQGINILSSKSVYSAFKIENIRSWAANIIKQHMLSLGADAAIERAALVKDINTNALIFGSKNQLKGLCRKLSGQPFGLEEVSRELSQCLRNLDKKEFTVQARDKVLKIKKPVICGIINITDDSFSGDGLLGFTGKNQAKVNDLALRQCARMLKQGARIIDIGAESARPGSSSVSDKEEISRLVPVLKNLRKEFKKAILSIDTYKYKVAEYAVGQGIDIINDITALRSAPKIADLIRRYKLGCVLMHMKGKPKNMQVRPGYKNVIEEQLDFFKDRIKFCRSKEIGLQQMLIDPGIGFGKRLKDNTRIVRELKKFKIFGLPVFIGLSRKTFIGELIGTGVDERFTGTVAANLIAVINGANILRVHDVKAAGEAVKVINGVMGNIWN